LLANVSVKTYIEEQAAKIQNKAVADAEETMRYLTSVLRGEVTDEILRLDGEGVQVKDQIAAATKERLKAAELLGKRYGLFSDKVNISGAVPVMFTDDLGE
jgi:phage terminase small subunit